MIVSLLDTDLYKLTMQAAIHKHYSNIDCEFTLTNRTPEKKFTKIAIDWLIEEINNLSNLRFTDDEINYLHEKLPYLTQDHLNWLKTVKLTPNDEITINLIPEDNNNDEDDTLYDITISVHGKWEIVTLYEIPVLALVSECYFKFIDTNWTINNQPSTDELITKLSNSKCLKLIENNCKFSEFGTRRRRSFQVQENVIKGMPHNDLVLGTSNVYFAKKYGFNPIGTIGHEWMMGVGAILSTKQNNGYNGYLMANKLSIEQYADTVGKENVGLALTDTYGTKSFLKIFKPFANWYIGVRQDSGDPYEYAKMIKNWYNEININNKIICFSDSLNVDKCIKLKEFCDNINIGCSFGIGTSFTNDFDSSPMNIVIKLKSCGGGNAIKISDNWGKNMGDQLTIDNVKKLLGYVENKWDEGDESKRW